MSDLLPYLVVGLVSGAVYSMAGVGLVVTYKTSGIFNFGNGAIAAVAAYTLYELWTKHGWPLPLALAVALLVVAILLGLGYELFARRLATAPVSYKIAGTVGLVLLVQGIVEVFYATSADQFGQFMPTTTVEIGGVNVSYAQLITFGISLGATAVLYFFFRFVPIGKSIRGLVDNTELLTLSGRNATVIRRCAWMIGCFFVALSGLLLSPDLQINSNSLTLLTVSSFGAAAIGAFTSVWRTWIGGLVIGVASALATKWTGSSPSLQGLPPSLPFIILFVVLVLSPRYRGMISEAFAYARTTWRVPSNLQVLGGILVAAALCLVPSFVGVHLNGWTVALTYVILFLSLGLLVRESGQVSLCHVAFAAVGAVAFSRLTHDAGVPWVPALLICGLAAVPVGALLAIPAIRSSGLYLAVATFGFGIMLQLLFYNTSIMFGLASSGLPLRPPHLSWLTLDSDRGYYYVVLVVVAIACAFVVLLTRTRLGRLLRGLGDSPVALASLGSSINLLRVMVFGTSAFLAGIAGALFGIATQQVTGASFDPLTSLILIAVLMIVPGGMPWYALTAGLSYNVVQIYVSGDITYYLQIIFGVSAIVGTVAPPIRVPAGARSAVEWLSTRLTPPRLRRSSSVRNEAKSAPPAIGGPGARTVIPAQLSLTGLSVRFGGVVAVNDLSLEVAPGSITGLIGPNGAGKSTTFNACTGMIKPQSGRITLGGVDLTHASTAARAQRGVGRTFQRMQLFDSLTTRSNVELGAEAGFAGSNAVRQFLGRRGESKAMRHRAAEAIDLCGLGDVADVPAGQLSTGQRRLVELARTLAGDFAVLLLDEPSSGLDSHETERFGEILLEVVRTRGIGIMLVEHDLDLVLRLCRDIYVLDFGNLIFHGSAKDAFESSAVRSAYLGEDFTTDASLPVSLAGVGDLR